MTANKISTLILQNIFFPGLKVKMPHKWKSALQSTGEVTNFGVDRAGGNISAAIVSPKGQKLDFKALPQVVILAHPLSKKAKYFFAKSPCLEFYASKGIPTVLFDFNGFGESERIDMFYWKDAEAVVNKTREMFPNAKILLHGASFGAFHIVRAIESLPAGSHALLENVSRSLLDYWKRWFLTRNAVKVLQALPIQSFRDMEILSSLKKLDRKNVSVSMIACADDKFTPPEEMQDLAKRSGLERGFHTIPGAAHLQAGIIALEQYKNILQGIVLPEGSPL